MKKIKQSQRSILENLIREYNEIHHEGTTLTGDNLYTLDESEVDAFLNWVESQL